MPDLSLREAMRTTRAVRRLRSDPIPDDVLRRVLEAATFAPSGGNRQAWRIIVVRDAALKRELATRQRGYWSAYAAAGRAMAASLPETSRERTLKALAAGDFLAEHFHETPVILVFCFDPRGLAI